MLGFLEGRIEGSGGKGKKVGKKGREEGGVGWDGMGFERLIQWLRIWGWLFVLNCRLVDWKSFQNGFIFEKIG